MKRTRILLAAATATAAAACLAAPSLAARSANADTTVPLTGPAVVVFGNELQPLTIDASPSGCTALPVLAHEVANLTAATITLYADPFCTIPASLPNGGSTIASGYGSHVSGAGSFKVTG